MTETNLVRATDAYVDMLDLPELGFTNSGSDLIPDQLAFDPGMLLKLYLSGYRNRARSSRRLERECRRNLELMWLLEGLVPSYRTIAGFRRVNGNALRAANRDFVMLCQESDLLGGETIAIDGFFFHASASDASIITTKKSLEAELKKIERDLEAYTQELDANDVQETDAGEGLGEAPALARKLEELKERQTRKQAQRERLEASDETQLSRTDSDARALSKEQHVAGYDVQSSVDEKHKIIVRHEVTNAGNDMRRNLTIFY